MGEREDALSSATEKLAVFIASREFLVKNRPGESFAIRLRLDEMEALDEARQRAERLEVALREIRDRTAAMGVWGGFKIAAVIDAALAADPQPAEAGGETRPAPKDKAWIKMEHPRGAESKARRGGGKEFRRD